ncbi:hypothetical protein D3C74_202550 [compost metagenome]
MFSFKESILSIEKLNILPKEYSNYLGVCVPFIEIAIAILLLFKGNNFIVNLAAIVLILGLIAINYKAVRDDNQADCFCLGNLVKTKIGYGGLIQCLFMLISVLPNVMHKSINIAFLYHIETIQIFFILITVILWAFLLIIIRKLIEILYVTTNKT